MTETTNTITKDTLFSAPRSKAENKADITDRTARAIIKAEAERRIAKSERLRQARLDMEARQPKPAPAKPRAAKASAKTARAARGAT